MKKRDIYRMLEAKMLSYTDYADIAIRPKNEPFASISKEPGLRARQVDADMLAYTGDRVFVRAEVLRRLKIAATNLASYDASLGLEIVYGYRALDIQKRLFEKYKGVLGQKYTGRELLAATHRLVAVPEVAGHPAGAAVDIQIIRAGVPLNFGTKVHEFVPDSFSFSPFIGTEAWQNRQLLRRIMIGAGFAPFDGEWWHFSYGDKEWACYYGQPAALYNQVDWPPTAVAPRIA